MKDRNKKKKFAHENRTCRVSIMDVLNNKGSATVEVTLVIIIAFAIVTLCISFILGIGKDAIVISSLQQAAALLDVDDGVKDVYEGGQIHIDKKGNYRILSADYEQTVLGGALFFLPQKIDRQQKERVEVRDRREALIVMQYTKQYIDQLKEKQSE